MAGLGTFTVGAGNVTLSQGRGKNKTLVMDVSFKELEVWAARNNLDEKKLWNKSYGRAVKNIKGKFQKIVSSAGGVEGVPKFTDFESFTKELREKKNISGRPMGGRLADKRIIKLEKLGKTTIIGWPSRLAEWAIRFQDGLGGQNFNSPGQRRYWHILGIKDIPEQYVSNPRRIIPEPFGSYVNKYLEDWARNIFYKELAKQMAKRRIATGGTK